MLRAQVEKTIASCETNAPPEPRRACGVPPLALCPSAARGLKAACEAIEGADLIALGPGSLYTSLLPVLLVRELGASIARSGARVVLLMTPIVAAPGSIRALGCRAVSRDPLGPGPKIRHDPARLARALLDLASGAPS